MTLKSLGVGLALSTAWITGCSNDDGQSFVETASAPAEADELADLANSLGVETPPDVPVVREISATEWTAVLEECMTEAGFPPVRESAGDVLEWEPTEDQQDAFLLSRYTCSAQYPIVDTVEPFGSDELGILYDYWTDKTIPCLAELGYRVSDMPSREAFMGGAIWDPRQSTYAAVSQDVAAGKWSSEEEVYSVACPTDPGWDP